MATITKTQGTSLLAPQSVASAAVLISSVLDVSTKFAATIFIHFGRRVVASLSAGCVIRVEASAKSSGEGHWFPIAEFLSDLTINESEAVSGTASAGATTVSVASTANLAAGDKVYFDNGTIANSEWHRIKSIVTNTSVTLEDALVNAQTGATIYDRAEFFVAQIDCTAIGRLRVVVDNTGTGQAIAVEAEAVTGDSIG